MRGNHAKVIGTDQNITIHRTVAYKNAQSCGCATAIDAKAIERWNANVNERKCKTNVGNCD